MSQTISNTVTATVVLDTPAVQNPLSITTTGVIDVTNGVGVSGTADFAWTVVNSGSVKGDAANKFNGIDLTAGGVITNGAGGAATALISGYTAIYVKALNSGVYGVATISNYGTILGGYNGGGIGVLTNYGGTILNGAGGLISSEYIGVEIENLDGIVTNLGTVVGAAGAGAIRLDGGTVVNAAGAIVNGGTGVAVYNAGHTFTLVNNGLLTVNGNYAAVRNASPLSVIRNFATISATAGPGVRLYAPGAGSNTVTNAASASILGYTGIQFDAGNGTVSNAGTIAGSGGVAVGFATGSNRLIVAPGAVFTGVVNGGGGASSNVIELASGSGTGTITGLGTSFTNFGTLAVDAGATWTISGTAPQTVSNLGTITTTGNLAVYIANGGMVTNGQSGSSSAVIVGQRSGIGLKGTLGATVTNFGTIRGIGSAAYPTLGDGIGFRLSAGAAVIGNNGLIQGYRYGIDINQSGTFTATGIITNSGTIVGNGIQGVGIAFYSAADTLTNSGTIVGASGTAVVFGGGNDRLIVVPGAVFGGQVDGGSGANAMEFAAGPATGTISGIGSSFTNFGTLTVDAGASWRFTGNTIGPGVTLVDAGSLSSDGSIATQATVAAGGYLANLAGGVIANASTAIKGVAGTVSIVNLGTVQATSGAAVYLAAGGGVSNGSAVSPDALISGYSGIVVRGAAGSVVNYGLISSSEVFSSGVALDIGGSLSNRGTIIATGSQSYAVFLGTGIVTNGAVGATAALIQGSGLDAVLFPSVGTVVNFGTIAAIGTTGVGVYLRSGGVVTNGASGSPQALISGADGVKVAGGPATVTSFGTIVGTGSAGTGVTLTAGSTLTNAGTIAGAGGIAVYFATGGSNRMVVDPGAYFGGMIAGGGGILELAVGGGGAGTLLGFGPTVTNFGTIQFDPGAVWTIEGSAAGLSEVITGFDAGDTIDVDGFVAVSDTYTGSALVLTDSGNNQVTLHIQGSYTTSDFIIASDNHGGTDVTTIACFLRGTLIRTAAGEVSVEDLVIGDRVPTMSGVARPVKWIGRRAYDPRFAAANRAVLPIRITAGALEDDVPARDLCVSPEHALHIDGSLVPARLLVNGATIRQEAAVDPLEYFHIELETHDVIFAEGAPAETFVDCDNRFMFHNAGEFAALYPQDAPEPWRFCAPRIEPGSAELAEIREKLLARAAVLGWFTDEPDLHLVTNGAALPAQSVQGQVRRFSLPAGSRHIALASRSAVPAETEVASPDQRTLGVAVERIVLYDAALRIEIGHNSTALCHGFHPAEEWHRWTDGRAALPETALACFADDLTVEITLVETRLHYPIDPAPGRRQAAASLSALAPPLATPTIAGRSRRSCKR